MLEASNFKTISFEETVLFLRSRGLAPEELKPMPRGTYGLWAGPCHLESLRLDHSQTPWETLVSAELVGIVVDGDLTIDGNLINGEQDFGPGLIVLGDMKAHNIAIAGAPLFVQNSLNVTEVFHGYYNHGSLIVRGGLRAKVFFASEYFGRVLGAIDVQLVDAGHVIGTFGERVFWPPLLVAELSEDEDAVGVDSVDCQTTGGSTRFCRPASQRSEVALLRRPAS